jgi:uncharacterized protein
MNTLSAPTAASHASGRDSEPSSSAPPRKPKPRGFAAMDPKKVSEIAKKGGRAAHEAGTAHRFTSTEAREAGRKGGMAPHKKRKTQDA